MTAQEIFLALEIGGILGVIIGAIMVAALMFNKGGYGWKEKNKNDK